MYKKWYDNFNNNRKIELYINFESNSDKMAMTPINMKIRSNPIETSIWLKILTHVSIVNFDPI
jgi:hypothetical protein